MAVPTLITDLSTTIASNGPAGSESPSSLDDYQRAHAGFIAQLYANTVAATTVIVASATSTAIGAAISENVDISGTTTITSFDTVAEGINRKGRFTGALTLTHNATSLILPGVANITTAANDRYEARSLGSGNWIVTKYQKADGVAVVVTAPFASGTRLGFQQTAAPLGWTKDTTAAIDDSILRFVTGSVTPSGGSVAFSTWNGQTATGAYTLLTADMPAHTHTSSWTGANDFVQGSLPAGAVKNPDDNAHGTFTTTSASTGGGGGHSHSLTQGLKFYDFIIASKD